MNSNSEPVRLRAIHDHVIVSGMNFDEIVTSAGIIVRSDDGKSHGVKPRWAQVYAIGPQQRDVQVGQWVLVEHGRWTRKVKVHTVDGDKELQRIDVDAILAVSDQAPSAADVVIGESV